MAVPLERFVKQLEESGILEGDTLKEFLPPKSEPKDAEELARELVRRSKLTKFQAEEVYKGKGKSLVLGNYVLIEKIGAGGMGQVFKARHRRMDRLVAVKLLPAAVMKDRAAVARFEREVKAAAKLSHPNIVAAHDADCAEGVHFLVMELVDGSDLFALVRRNGPLTVDTAVDYIRQAAKGLEAAHAEGVVHRDIKPGNLLLDKKGVVKILDMGLARLNTEGDGSPQAELTHTGTIMGTIDYMAPEQALDTKSADARADIYSLGCSLFFLLTGRPTYEAETVVKKLLAHRSHPIPLLRSVCPQAPEELEAVFTKMVAKKVVDRYQTITDVIAALEGCNNPSSDASQTILAEDESAASHGSPRTRSVESSTDVNLTDFLGNLPSAAARAAATKKPATRNKSKLVNDEKKLLLISVGVLGVVILFAAVLVKMRTNGGNGTSVARMKSGKTKSKNTESLAVQSIPPEQAAVAAGKPWESPAFRKWIKDVQAMPAEKQVEAVSKKLVESNPGFDGKISYPADDARPPVIEDGNVVELRILIDRVADLSPLRAFSELRRLECGTRQGAQPPLDLSALNGMKIHGLVCVGLRVDFSTVRGLPLSDLGFVGGGLTDLSPLAGMPLKSLTVSGNWEIKSLEPLKGMPLTTLACDNCQVADLSPLRGMQLTTLISHVTQVADLSPLKGMPLGALSCGDTPVTDLSPLAGMKLKWFSFTPSPKLEGVEVIRQMDTLAEIGTAYEKIIPSNEFWKKYDAGEFGEPRAFRTASFDQWIKDVQAMPAEKQVEAVSGKLKELNPEFDGKMSRPFWEERPPLVEDGNVVELKIFADKVPDLSPIRALSNLRQLECWATQNTGAPLDLSPLMGMKIRTFKCFGLHPDLSMLKRLPLSELVCIGGNFTHLTPLSGMPLKELVVSGNWEIKSLEPLKGMALTGFACDNSLVADLSPLSGMPLTYLVCHVTQVADLSPLKGMPLESLYCDGTLVKDLSPLAGMKLKRLSFTPNPERKGIEAIRQMDTLVEIGAEYNKLISRDEFWKKYDAGEFSKR